MEKTGQMLKRHKAVIELQNISDEFAQAMVSAHTPWVAETGRMTLRMEEIWARYVKWSQTNEKDFV